MAKRKPRKRTFLMKGAIDKSLPLLTLADVTVLSADVNDVVTEQAFALSMEATWTLADATANEDPITVGIAHSDYSDAEIEEYLENLGAWERGDLVQQERAKRKVRIVGTFSGNGTLNDGRPIKTKCKFTLTTGQTISIWAWNKSGATLTTGALVKVSGHIWLKPF